MPRVGGVTIRNADLWRATAGRFTSKAVHEAAAAAMQPFGDYWVNKLRQDTPRVTGKSATAWTADYNVAKMELRFTNRQFGAWGKMFGVVAHDIPRAFGKPLPFGIGGRFEGKFHPGYPYDETLHKDFEDLETQARQVIVRETGKSLVIKLTHG
jgi:hypothetical protein